MLQAVVPVLPRFRAPSAAYVIQTLEARRLLTAILSDQTVTSSIAAAGEVDEYTFAAAAGAAVVAFAAETAASPFAPSIELFAPDGTSLGNDRGEVGADVVVDDLPLTGTYTLRVRDRNDDDTGGYALTVAVAPGTQLPGGDGVALTSGPRHAATIGVGDVDVFTVQVNPGDHVWLSIADAGDDAFTPQMRIYGPGGELVTVDAGDDGVEHEFMTANATTQTYYVVVKDRSEDDVSSNDTSIDTGTYAFTMAKVPGNQTDDAGEGGLLSSGPRFTGNIARADLDVFRIEANQGDRVVLSLVDPDAAGFEPRLVVFDPDGNELERDYGPDGTDVFFTAPSSGTHYVLVKDRTTDDVSSFDVDFDTGRYFLYMAKLPDVHADDGSDGGPLASGPRTTGSVGYGDIDVWELTADVGDSIVGVVRSLDEDELDARVLLYSPAGELLDSTNGASTSLVEAEQVVLGGTYYVVVKDFFDDNVSSVDVDVESGDYALTFVTVPQDAPFVDADSGALTSGAARAGAVGNGDLDVYTFPVTAGQSFTINLAETSASDAELRFRVFDPSGAQIADRVSTFTLDNPTTGGTYTVVVSDDVGDDSGPYSIALNADPGADTFAPRALHADYRFDAPRAELRVIFSEGVGPSFSASDVTITNLDTNQTVPNGQLAVSYQADSDLARVTFPAFPNRVLPDGNYRLRIAQANVTDAAGNPLTGDVVVEFFTLGGDANRDRVVNLRDFDILAANFGRANKRFSQGDFNYDGVVTLQDFNILAARFGQSVAPDAFFGERKPDADGEEALVGV